MFHYDGQMDDTKWKNDHQYFGDSPMGSVFLGSVDASTESTDSTKMHNFFLKHY